MRITARLVDPFSRMLLVAFTNTQRPPVPVLAEIVNLCPGPASLYAPFGWADLPIPPPERVVKNRWTRAVRRSR